MTSAADIGVLNLGEGPHGRPLITMTWILRQNGLVELRAISISKRHKKYSAGVGVAEVKEHEGSTAVFAVIRSWQEEREADHLFGGTDELLALATGPNSAGQRISDLQKEREALAVDNQRMRKALSNLHQECSQVSYRKLLDVGPMIAPTERTVLAARAALNPKDPT